MRGGCPTSWRSGGTDDENGPASSIFRLRYCSKGVASRIPVLLEWSCLFRFGLIIVFKGFGCLDVLVPSGRLLLRKFLRTLL